MPQLPKFPPSSLRPDPSVSLGIRNTRAAEPRPYLLSTPYRRTEILNNAGDRISPSQRTMNLFPHESEDARLTGSTRSLFRRLLALNLPTGSTAPVAARQQPVSTAKFINRSASA